MQQLPFSESTWEKIWVGVFLFLVGALLTHIWNRFRNRLASLTWTSFYTRAAVSSEDSSYGEVKVLYNNVAVRNLGVVALTLVNESNRDLTDIRFVFGFQEGTRILLSEGSLGGSLEPFVISPAFMSEWHRRAQDDPKWESVAYYHTHREYDIRVLNRDTSARFAVLVTRDDFAEPAITASCSHLGVQLRNRAPTVEFLGVSQTRAQVLGLVLSLLATVWLVTAHTNRWILGLTAWARGVLVLLLGALVIRVTRALVRTLG